MAKSSGIFYRPPPASFEEHLDRTFAAHLERRSNEYHANKLRANEKTIRNWKSLGLPKSAVRVLKILNDNPDLRAQIFDDQRCA